MPGFSEGDLVSVTGNSFHGHNFGNNKIGKVVTVLEHLARRPIGLAITLVGVEFDDGGFGWYEEEQLNIVYKS